MTTLANLTEQVESLRSEIAGLQLRLSGTVGGQCSAEYPHANGLVFMRSPSGNHYICQNCQKVYVKGAGVLKEVS